MMGCPTRPHRGPFFSDFPADAREIGSESRLVRILSPRSHLFTDLGLLRHLPRSSRLPAPDHPASSAAPVPPPPVAKDAKSLSNRTHSGCREYIAFLRSNSQLHTFAAFCHEPASLHNWRESALNTTRVLVWIHIGGNYFRVSFAMFVWLMVVGRCDIGSPRHFRYGIPATSIICDVHTVDHRV
jgi:hypothetical protein